ncbi:hypothetical protein QTP86_033118 [Hemibagrus guttatus]|nr:hypothetical protein QTP86_033118 [Hemibagrus guttatus]
MISKMPAGQAEISLPFMPTCSVKDLVRDIQIITMTRQRSSLLTSGERKEGRTTPSTSTEWLSSVYPASSFWGPTSQRTCPGPPIPPVWSNQHLFFLNTLKKNHLFSTILVNFYRCTIESILTNCITVWYGNCSVADRKALQWEVKTTQRIIGTPLEDIQKKRCLHWAHSILKDSSHPLPIAFSNFYPLEGYSGASRPKPAD